MYWPYLWRTGSVSDTTLVACSFSPCSQVFMTGSTYGDLRLWNLDMKQLVAEKNAHDLGVTCCTFSPIILSSKSHFNIRSVKSMSSSKVFVTSDCSQSERVFNLKLWVCVCLRFWFCHRWPSCAVSSGLLWTRQPFKDLGYQQIQLWRWSVIFMLS